MGNPDDGGSVARETAAGLSSDTFGVWKSTAGGGLWGGRHFTMLGFALPPLHLPPTQALEMSQAKAGEEEAGPHKDQAKFLEAARIAKIILNVRTIYFYRRLQANAKRSRHGGGEWILENPRKFCGRGLGERNHGEDYLQENMGGR
eukprot:GHVT01029758.1.p2 GENE.GHVT01029758.1~~GHVT01029758.1.p2  ORF type:complete len:146 (-),score=28.10 GHVT01029758.1:982-1419(-)